MVGCSEPTIGDVPPPTPPSTIDNVPAGDFTCGGFRPECTF